MKYRQLNGEERSVLAALRIGGAEAGGDRAGAWAASQHGVARTQAQRGPTMDGIERGSAGNGLRAALSLAAQQANLDAGNGSEWKGCCAKSGAPNKSPGTCA